MTKYLHFIPAAIALSIGAPVPTATPAKAQSNTEISGTIIYNTDTGKFSGNVGGQATQTRGGTTTGVGVQYDGKNLQGQIIVRDEKQPQTKR